MRYGRWLAGSAAATIVALWLVPPYAVIDDAAAGARHAAVGHRPLWRPPSLGEATQALTRAAGSEPSDAPPRLRVIRNFVRLGFETTVVVLVAGILGVALRRKGPAPPPEPFDR